ncbi:hypothetical protein P3X46_020375 [Hevea brasiliensis]|uniref:Terpene synthase metal-binding domain-containing protein n=1 Tax=Hevea brasiliensis TaxID=3981 RepID=A0ABQ9LLP5_HEVBR|nr:hypothetical protein P3X46_020375 [Hevea brasiliensis]
MFENYGFWGDCDGRGMPTIGCLPATIACMVALKRWNAEEVMFDRGNKLTLPPGKMILFLNIHANAKKLIGEISESCPRWFAIIFLAMIELARTNGLDIVFPDRLKGAVMDIFCRRQEILQGEKLVDKYHYPPLLAYLKALPLYNIDQEHVVKHLSNDGSLFQSPSATARAFMATGNEDCLSYLQNLIEKCPKGVLPTYPMDEELIKLCMVNQLQRLGLAEHFKQVIGKILELVHSNYMDQESNAKSINSVVLLLSPLYKDSLAFWLLRMHGYKVSPGMFCCFLDEGIQDHIKNNQEFFSSVMLNVHMATDLMFPVEYELEEAQSFSRKLLEKSIPVETRKQKDFPFQNFHTMHELRFPWLARLDQLDHRMWIEEKNHCSMDGKSLLYFDIRFSSLHNDRLMQLATRNREFRPSIYMKELEGLKRWSKSWSLTDMGFAREKTAYCYFAVSASASLPLDSDIRMTIAKSGIIITVANDFFDMEGSLGELEKLTDAIRRWDTEGLSGHSRIIFDVLDDLVREMAATYLQQEGSDITASLRYIWYETFNAWFTEAKWSRSGSIPSAEDYLETGMTSIATHTVVLPASCFLNPSLLKHKLKPPKYEAITKLVMIIPRLLNDIQSYEKEQKDGKTNFVLLRLEKKPGAEVEDSIAITKEILKEKKRELIQHALKDGFKDLPKQCRHLYLSFLKVFQMFFNSSNRYDSTTEMLQDIQKAIYLPLEHYRISTAVKCIAWPLLKHPSMNMPTPLNFKLCFI